MNLMLKGLIILLLTQEKPIKTFIGNFEFQLVTGRLEPFMDLIPNIDRTYAGTKLFVPKINQNAETGDWRFFQGYTITYSPIWVPCVFM